MPRHDEVQVRRGTAAEWTAVNPTLADGEPGFEHDTLQLKIGDGVTPWNDLDYLVSTPVGGDLQGLSDVSDTIDTDAPDGGIMLWDNTAGEWVTTSFIQAANFLTGTLPGFLFGSLGDTSIYRLSAGVLATDGSMRIPGDLQLIGNLTTNGVITADESASGNSVLRAFVTGDSFYRYRVYASGLIEWGSGSLAADVNLYRGGADALYTDDAFLAARGVYARGDDVFYFAGYQNGDSQYRFRVLKETGEIQWATGAAVPDVNLYRLSANVLKTDDAFIVGTDQYVGFKTSAGQTLTISGDASNDMYISTPGGGKLHLLEDVAIDGNISMTSGGGGGRYWSVSNATAELFYITNLSAGGGLTVVTKAGGTQGTEDIAQWQLNSGSAPVRVTYQGKLLVAGSPVVTEATVDQLVRRPIFYPEDGEDGQTIPGPPGTPGGTGTAGAAGRDGLTIPGAPGEDADNVIIPGPPGNPGGTGATGSQGLPGLTIPGQDGDEPLEIIVPGPPGNPGGTGATGAAGQTIIGPPGLPGDDAEDTLVIPGARGATGASGGSGTLTAFTKDLGVAYRSGVFDVTGLSGITVDQSYDVRQTAAAISTKGNARDEAELDMIHCAAYGLSTTSLRVYWFSENGSVQVGDYAFVAVT